MKFDQEVGKYSSEDFIRLKDREKVTGIFRGDIFTFHRHWIGRNPKPCTGPACELCKSEHKPKFTFNVNFVVKAADSSYVPKLFQGGWRLYQQLKSINSDYDLEKTIISITRNGTDTNTTYAILPIKDYNVSAELEHKLGKLSLLDIKVSNEPELPVAAHTQSFADDEVPF